MARQTPIIVPLLLLVLASMPAFAADGSLEHCLAVAGGSDKEEFLAFDRELRWALSTPDPVAMALLVSYPLRINDRGGGTLLIDNAAALQARFAEVFSPPVRSTVLAERPENVGCTSSGVMYGAGVLWVAVAPQGPASRYLVVTVNSPDAETRSPPARRIEFVCRAEKHRVIVDSEGGERLRYRAWNGPRFVTDQPDLEISPGAPRFEGSGPCAYPLWVFRRGDTELTVGGLGCFPASDPPPDGAKGTLEVSVAGQRKARWWCY